MKKRIFRLAMWVILESRQVQKAVPSLPREVIEHYEFWKNVVRTSGPQGLRSIKSYRDHKLQGEWAGWSASYLNKQYRVIYRRVADQFVVEVVRVSLHDYKK